MCGQILELRTRTWEFELGYGTNLDIDDDLAVADAAGVENAAADTAVIGVGPVFYIFFNISSNILFATSSFDIKGS